MEDAKSMKTLMYTSIPMSKDKLGKLVDQTIYRGIIAHFFILLPIDLI